MVLPRTGASAPPARRSCAGCAARSRRRSSAARRAWRRRRPSWHRGAVHRLDERQPLVRAERRGLLVRDRQQPPEVRQCRRLRVVGALIVLEVLQRGAAVAARHPQRRAAQEVEEVLHHRWMAADAREENRGVPAAVGDVEAVGPELRDDPLEHVQVVINRGVHHGRASVPGHHAQRLHARLRHDPLQHQQLPALRGEVCARLDFVGHRPQRLRPRVLHDEPTWCPHCAERRAVAPVSPAASRFTPCSVSHRSTRIRP